MLGSWLQLGALAQCQGAQQLQRLLLEDWPDQGVVVFDEVSLYRVQLGPSETR